VIIIAALFACAALNFAFLMARMLRCPAAIYEENRQYALDRFPLSDHRVDLALCRRSRA
jgi:hypothetical protein